MESREVEWRGNLEQASAQLLDLAQRVRPLLDKLEPLEPPPLPPVRVRFPKEEGI